MRARASESFVFADNDDPCVHCEADGSHPRPHADDCPFATGLWPVAESGKYFVCSGCDERHEIGCARCDGPLEGAYRLVDRRSGLLVVAPTAPADVICLDCANAQTEELVARLEAMGA